MLGTHTLLHKQTCPATDSKKSMQGERCVDTIRLKSFCLHTCLHLDICTSIWAKLKLGVKMRHTLDTVADSSTPTFSSLLICLLLFGLPCSSSLRCLPTTLFRPAPESGLVTARFSTRQQTVVERQRKSRQTSCGSRHWSWLVLHIAHCAEA